MLKIFFKLEKIAFYKLTFSVGLLTVIMMGCLELRPQELPPPYINNFNKNDQGWRVSVIQTEIGTIPYYSTTGGNQGGYIYASDKFTTFWYFIASKSFINEAKKGYNKDLRFDLKQSKTDSQLDGDDVILTDGNNTITFNTAHNPTTNWTSYSIKLNELSGWKKGKLKATKTDVQNILKNLSDLRIRGEFRTGIDTCGLDNVAIY